MPSVVFGSEKDNAQAEDLPGRLIAWSQSANPSDRLGSLILSGHLLAAKGLQGVNGLEKGPAQDYFQLQQAQLKQAALDLAADPLPLKTKNRILDRFAKHQQWLEALLKSLNPEKFEAAVTAAASVLKERYQLEPYASDSTLPGGINRLMVNVIFWATHMQARHTEINKTPRPLPGFWELIARLGALPSPLTKP
ncbi:MAG: hypothetical protein K2X01_10165 [Cyanobacteria bacterium]|nr:hypothetical protein [Cyanobacteriota bacterium]